MIYINDKKVVFTAIPKTGTRSVYAVLKNKYGAQLYKEHHDLIPEHMKDFYSFTIVRNPYDRVVSMWWSTCQRDYSNRRKLPAGGNFPQLAGGKDLKSLLKWMLREKYEGKGSELLSTQAKYLKKNKFDKILHNETLSDEFSLLPFLNKGEILGVLNSTRKIDNNNNISRNSDAFEYIDQEALNMINEYYTEDFELLPEYKKIINIDDI